VVLVLVLWGIRTARDTGEAQDTGHIVQVLKVTLGFDTSPNQDFHTLLYTTQVEFQPLQPSWLRKMAQHALLPLAGMGVLLGVARALYDFHVLQGAARADRAFLLLQALACCIMAGLMMRFIVLGGPMCCLLACLPPALAPAPARLGLSPRVWRECLSGGLLLLVLGLGGANIALGWDVSSGDPPSLVEKSAQLGEWIRAHTPPEAVFYSDFVTLSAVKLGGNRAIVIHPQYENKELRDRAAEVYKLYGHFAPSTVAHTARGLNATHMVVDRRHCTWKTGGGMSFTELIDTLGGNAEQLFCSTVHTPEGGKFFELLYHNFEYSVFRILGPGGMGQALDPHRYAQRVAKEDPHAGANLCQYAAFLEEHFNARPIANELYEATLKARHTTQDPQCLVNHAIHLDEDLGDVVPARKFYEAAVEAGPGMGSILGDYAYFLHLQQENTKAIATFRKAVEAAPSNAHVLCSFSAVLNSNKLQSEAGSMYLRARNADPGEQCVMDLAPTFGYS